jgi:hypothetical protein
MDANLPAPAPDTGLVESDEREPLPRRQPISVAFLPLGLVVFLILAFVIAAWTFLAAGG